MEWLVLSGAAVTLLGLAGLILSIRRALVVRKAGLSDAETRDALQRIMPLNLGSLFLSVIGLMMVVVGVFLA